MTKPAAFTFCKVGTIREIHQQLLHDGYRVSQYALRQWIKSGDIPAVYAGNKALISYCNVPVSYTHLVRPEIMAILWVH